MQNILLAILTFSEFSDGRTNIPLMELLLLETIAKFNTKTNRSNIHYAKWKIKYSEAYEGIQTVVYVLSHLSYMLCRTVRKRRKTNDWGRVSVCHLTRYVSRMIHETLGGFIF